MNCQQWLALFSRNTDDVSIREALAKNGITASSLEVEKDSTTVRRDISGEGITLVFTDEAYLYQRDDMAIGEGAPILSEINLFLVQNSEYGSVYTGSLPYNLKRTVTQIEARKALGEPNDSDDDPPWDEWIIDNLILTVEYADDLKSLITVSFELPQSG